MENKGFKIAAIVALCVAVAGLSVAYAALSQSLTVTTNAKATGLDATWNVFLSVEDGDECTITNLNKSGSTAGGSTASSAGTIATDSAARTNIVISDVVLAAPGDQVTCTFHAKNTGSMDAILNGVSTTGAASNNGLVTTVTGTTGATKDADEAIIKAQVTYAITEVGGTAITTGTTAQLANTSGTHQYQVTLTYNKDANSTQIPAQEVVIGPIVSTFDYVQDGTAS